MNNSLTPDFLEPRELVPKEAYSSASNIILVKTKSRSSAALDDQWGYTEHFDRSNTDIFHTLKE